MFFSNHPGMTFNAKNIAWKPKENKTHLNLHRASICGARQAHGVGVRCEL